MCRIEIFLLKLCKKGNSLLFSTIKKTVIPISIEKYVCILSVWTIVICMYGTCVLMVLRTFLFCLCVIVRLIIFV